MPPRARRGLRRAGRTAGKSISRGCAVRSPALPLPAWDDGRIRLAVDVSNWLRPDAEASPQRLFCHCYARGKGNAQMIPGWPYSWVAALSPGRTSWTLPLGTRSASARPMTPPRSPRPSPGTWSRGSSGSGQWKEGDPDIIIVFNAGYDLTRLAWLLAGLQRGGHRAGRLRSNRVMHLPAPPLPAQQASTGGRRPRHGHKLAFEDPQTWPGPAVTTVTGTARYGTATAMAWPRLHQRLEHRGSWEGHDGELPVIEGTLIRLAVDRLPGQRDADPVWLWSSRAAATKKK